MHSKYFTLQEATALLPKLAELLVEARELKRRADAKISQWRQGGEVDPVEMALARGQVEFLLSEVNRRLEEVCSLGCLPKDLEKGLVDFPTWVPNRGEAYLCWRLGEGEIVHWHGLTEGFSDRKPLPRVPSFFLRD